MVRGTPYMTPWRPSDIEQREGRIIRQGNQNEKVEVFRYVTENTFDAYMWQTIENKQKFISQIMTSKSPVRACEDIDETALSYAEVKALATGNPYIKEKMDLDIEVSRLKLLKADYQNQKYALEDKLLKSLPREIKYAEELIAGYKADIILYEQHKTTEFPGMNICGTTYSEKKDAGAGIIATCKAQTSKDLHEIGSYRGFPLMLSYDTFYQTFKLTIKGEVSHVIELGSDIYGNIQRLDNAFEAFPAKLQSCEQMLANLSAQMGNAKIEIERPFEQEAALAAKSSRLAELDALLSLDKRENDALDTEQEQQAEEPRESMSKSVDEMER